MKAKVYSIAIDSDMGEDGAMNELEKLVKATHKLLEFYIGNDLPMNEPSMQALTQAAGQLNIALYLARLRNGVIQPGSGPNGSNGPIQTPGVIQ